MPTCNIEIAQVQPITSCPTGAESILLYNSPVTKNPSNPFGYATLNWNILAECLTTQGIVRGIPAYVDFLGGGSGDLFDNATQIVITDINAISGYVTLFIGGSRQSLAAGDYTWSWSPGTIVVTLGNGQRKQNGVSYQVDYQTYVNVETIPCGCQGDLFTGITTGVQTINLLNTLGNIFLINSNTINDISINLVGVSTVGDRFYYSAELQVNSSGGIIGIDALNNDQYNSINIGGSNTVNYIVSNLLGGIEVQVTGNTNKTIYWYANIKYNISSSNNPI